MIVISALKKGSYFLNVVHTTSVTRSHNSKCQKVNKFYGRLNEFLGYSMALDMFKTS